MCSSLGQFLRSLHRRLVLVRIVERTGACVAIAANFATVLVAAAWTIGRDGLGLGMALLTLGAAVGLLWGLVKRPHLMDAAVEADRQLRLSDLLSTALLAQAKPDAWSRAVIAQAEARCRTITPSDVVFHRFGGRTWGAIGVSAMMVVTLGLMTSLPEVRRAQALTFSPASRPDRDAERSVAATATPLRHLARGEDDRPVGQTEAPGDEGTAAGLGKGSGSSAGGAGVGQSSDRSSAGLPRTSVAGNDAAGGDVSSGGGGAAPRPDASTDPSRGHRSGTSEPRTAPPPWKASSWPQDRGRAVEAVRSGAVPDAYREVVRRYFDDSPGVR